MNNSRCLICRKSKMTLKKLKSHIMARHSKLQIVKLFLKNNLMHVMRKEFFRKPKSKSSLINKVGNKKKFALPKKYKNDICPSTKILTPPSEDAVIEPSGCFSPVKDCTNFVTTESQKMDCINNNLSQVITENNNTFQKSEVKIESHNSKFFKLDNEDVTENVEIESAHIKVENTSMDCRMTESRVCTEVLHPQTVKNEVKTPESDTESCSDNGKNILLPYLDQRLYCNICGNGYNTENKLLQHLRIHRMECRICYQIFTNPESYKEHMKKHTLKVFACYVCTSEFLHKKNLIDHLNMHYEQEVLESVLDMEQDYNISKNYTYYNPSLTSHMVNCDYMSKINQIIQYLGANDQYFYPKRYYHNYNYHHNNNNINEHAYAKVICDVCYQELFLHEYQSHLKYMHSHHFANHYY